MRPNRLFIHVAAISSVLILTAAFAGDAAKSPAGITVTPIGVELRVETPGLDDLRIGNHGGVELELLIQTDAGGLIELDDDATKVSLTAGKTKLETRIGMMPKFSPDGRMAIVDLTAAAPPVGMHELHATGTLVLRAATQTTTEKVESVTLTAGTKFKIEKTNWTIKSAGKPQWGDAAMEVELEAKTEPGALKQVRFLDPSGREIESSPGSSSTMRFGGQVQISKSYALKQKVDVATIEFVFWKDMKSIEAPLDVTATAGWTGKPRAQK